MSRAFIGIGSNLGDRQAHLQLAVDHLHRPPEIEVRAVSRVYETDPVGGPVQGDFLNAVLEVTTTLSPHELLAVCQSAERAADRVRAERWGPRTLDVDVLLFDDVRSDDPALTLPHPRLAERAFVLAPLHDLDPTRVTVPPDGWEGVRPASVALRLP
ncbi:MAG: 2-amino-4-hydroxy-6-hydroxymethyldihydropteridine diphosphokinase [Acidimicrobiia bacterium]